jgi:hypothetical protein
MRLIIPNATPHIFYMMSRSPRNRGVPPLLMKVLGIINPTTFMGRRGRLHKLLGPIQQDSAQKEATSVFSLDSIAFKNSMHDKRKDKQRKNVPLNKFDCLFGFHKSSFGCVYCFCHRLHPLLHNHLMNILSCFLTKTNRSTTMRNCHEL